MAQDLNQLKTFLLEAQLALHKLMTGTKEVTVEFGQNRRVTYSEVNVSQLRRYITELESQIAVAEGGRARGPIYQVFGR
jgi:carbamate kinase